MRTFGNRLRNYSCIFTYINTRKLIVTFLVCFNLWFFCTSATGQSLSVLGHQKISNTEGNFTGTLDWLDFFGSAVTALGDVDGDGADEFGVNFVRGEGGESVLRNFVVTNCAIGIVCIDSSPAISFVTVVDNSYGVIAWGEEGPDIISSIFRDNSQTDLDGAQARYSCVQGGDPGEGNISDDPLFADDPNGDYHLRCRMGRFQPGAGGWVLDETTSPCIDAGDPTVNPLDEPMPSGGRVNMGAYGGSVHAGKSPNDWPNGADLNFDGIVNLADVAILCGNWMWSAPWAE